MDTMLLQEINQMRADLMYMVEQGLSVQDLVVVEKSQALDALITVYLKNQAGYCVGVKG